MVGAIRKTCIMDEEEGLSEIGRERLSGIDRV